MNRKTVLLIEDNRLTLEAMSAFLVSRCKQLFVAKDAEEAYEIFKAKLPDVLITDIRLPGKNGLELAKEAKEIKKDTIIFVISAYASDEYIEKMAEIGINRFFAKPLDLDVFEENFSAYCLK